MNGTASNWPGGTAAAHAHNLTFGPRAGAGAGAEAHLVLLGGSHDDSAAVLIGHTPGETQLCKAGPQLLCNGLQLVYLVQRLIHQRLVLQALHPFTSFVLSTRLISRRDDRTTRRTVHLSAMLPIFLLSVPCSTSACSSKPCI